MPKQFQIFWLPLQARVQFLIKLSLLKWLHQLLKLLVVVFNKLLTVDWLIQPAMASIWAQWLVIWLRPVFKSDASKLTYAWPIKSRVLIGHESIQVSMNLKPFQAIGSLLFNPWCRTGKGSFSIITWLVIKKRINYRIISYIIPV